MRGEGFHHYRMPRAALSAREREIAVLMREGHSRRQAAELIRLQVSTIDSILRSVFQKLQVRSMGELVALDTLDA